MALEKTSPLVLLTALNCYRIVNAPIRRHRLAGPDRARFRRCLIAYREDKVNERCSGARKLVPVLAVQSLEGSSRSSTETENASGLPPFPFGFRIRGQPRPSAVSTTLRHACEQPKIS